MSTVTFQNVKKSYAEGEILHGINLNIRDGEFLVIVGPSGCGKSTLLRLVAGLEKISNGNIYINEQIVNDIEPKNRNIAMVFQNYALYPHMSIYKNMAYGLRMHRYEKNIIRERVEQAAEMLQLKEVLNRKPHELSGGQRQRVAMGRAIVRNPQVFLFDEPLSNLDAKLRVHMRLEIKKMHQKLKTTTIYVTHDQVEAMTLADRLVVMHGGIIEQIGTPKEVYHSPASTFVGSFIGSPAMNFLPGKINNDGTKVAIDHNFLMLSKTMNVMHRNKDVIVGIRPEYIVPAEKSDQENLLKLDIQLTESLGAINLIHGLIHNTEHHLTISLPERGQFERNQMQISLPAQAIQLFHPENGKRIEFDQL